MKGEIVKIMQDILEEVRGISSYATTENLIGIAKMCSKKHLQHFNSGYHHQDN